MIGKITAISITCKVCNKVFAMNRREILWYSNMGYPLPKRCPECRKKKGVRDNVSKKGNTSTCEPQ